MNGPEAPVSADTAAERAALGAFLYPSALRRTPGRERAPSEGRPPPGPEVEGCLTMKVEEDPGWAPEPVLQGPGSSEAETFRRRFRRFSYEDAGGPREAFRQLWGLCCRWLQPELRSKEQILELLVVEQFLTILPEKIQAWAQTQCPESGEEAVALVIHLEKETGRVRRRVSSPAHSEGQATPAAAWDGADFQPQPQGGSREDAGSLRSGQQEPLNEQREHRPFPKHARPAPRAPTDQWNTADQEATAARPPAGAQGPAGDVHAASGLPHGARERQPHAPGGLCPAVGEVAALGSATSTSDSAARPGQGKEPWALGLHAPRRRDAPGSSHAAEKSAQTPARGAGKAWRTQQRWGLEDEKVAGVHWSYEETKTFLAILRESRFYETLQACPRNSQVYGAVAEWLRACGFLRTPEQCRTKFKSLQKSYRRARNGHAPEPCAFFEDMDALLNPAAPARETGPLPRPRRAGLGAEAGGLSLVRKAEVRGAPAAFHNLSAGVHWGYEETKTFLGILRETRFYEALQACHRKSKLYGAVAERLRACGFLRTPEQCRTKFKSLQKSYRRARHGHALEPCAFYQEMDALVNARASVPATSSPEVPSPSGPRREGTEVEPQEPAGWGPEETSPEAVVEDSGSEGMSEAGNAQESEPRGRPCPLQSLDDLDLGASVREDVAQGTFKDMAQPRALPGRAARGAAQNADPGRHPKRDCVSGRPWEAPKAARPGRLPAQPRDSGRALVPPRPFPGRRPCRLLKFGDGCGRGARLGCRAAHPKGSPCKCSACGKSLGRSRGLARSQRAPAGDRPPALGDCGRSLVPFKGGDCERTCSGCARLREHRRTHAADRRLGRGSVQGRPREDPGRDRLLPPPPPGACPAQPQKGRADELRRPL